MKNNILKIISLLFFLFLVSVLFLPISLIGQGESIILNSPSQSCAGSQRTVNLTWTSTITGNPDYYILRKIQGESSYTQIAGPQKDTFYTDNTALSDKDYLYRIKAVKGVNTYYSNEEFAPSHYCAPILSYSCFCQDDGPYINLTWSSVSGDLLKYEIYRDGAKIGETTNTFYSDGPNIEGTKIYNYYIKAIWQNGTNKDSESVSIQALACPPVLNISSSCLDTQAPGGPVINLSWNNLLGVTTYQIYRKALSEESYILLSETTDSSYQDKLVETLTDSYNQTGNISYYIKAKWATDEKDSLPKQVSIPQCPPFLKTNSYCIVETPSIVLSWTKTQGATHYNIYKNGEFTKQVASSETSWTDYDVNNDSTYQYKVEAVFIGGSKDSNEVSQYIDCRITSPPSPAPVLSKPTPICRDGDSQIDLSWTASEQVTAYWIWRNNNQYIERAPTFYTDSGVEGGYKYDYYIEAYNKVGSVFSNLWEDIMAFDCSVPSVPSLNLTRNCKNGEPVINLSWSETTNTYQYEIKRGLTPESLETKIIFDQDDPEFSSHSWQDTDVEPSTTYYYQVIAHGPPGTGTDGKPIQSESEIKSEITYSCFPTTPVLSLSRACENGNPVVNLSWFTDHANTDHYEIFREDAGDSPVQIIYPPDTNWKDKAVGQETTYNYRIEAVGPTGVRTKDPATGYKSITTYNCQPPGSFTLDEPDIYCQGSYSRADLTWTESTNADSYDVLRNQISPSETTTIYNRTSPYTDSGFGRALEFDGTNNYVDCGNGPSLQLGTNDFTIEAWIKTNESSFCK